MANGHKRVRRSPHHRRRCWERDYPSLTAMAVRLVFYLDQAPKLEAAQAAFAAELEAARAAEREYLEEKAPEEGQ